MPRRGAAEPGRRIGLLVMLFPAVGLGVAGFSLLERRRAVRFAMERLESRQPMFVLVDPTKPTRTLWIELY